MNAVENAIRSPGANTLPVQGTRAWSIQAVLLAASAAVLPAVCHLTGLPVRSVEVHIEDVRRSA